MCRDGSDVLSKRLDVLSARLTDLIARLEGAGGSVAGAERLTVPAGSRFVSITSCFQCRHFERRPPTDSVRFYCRLECDGILGAGPDYIPDWCPLPRSVGVKIS
jgi:hypothetical protein